MNLFSLPGCELYGGKEQSILFIIISAVLVRAVLHRGPSGSSCWVVTTRFSPQLRSSLAARGRFSGNLPTILICDTEMKVMKDATESSLLLLLDGLEEAGHHVVRIFKQPREEVYLVRNDSSLSTALQGNPLSGVSWR